MPYARLRDGAELHYVIDDFTDPWVESPTIVMVHGFCRNLNFWYAWIPHLARDFRVIRFDHRGCGRSKAPDPGFEWSLEQYADDVRDFLDAVGVESPILIGESMGGMMMPFFLNRHPGRIAGFVACSSNLGLKGPMAKEMAGGADSMVAAIEEAPRLQDYIRRTEKSRLHPDEMSETAQIWYADEWARTPRRIWEEWATQIVPNINVTPELLGGVDVPVLFLAPTRCVKLPVEEAETWKRGLADCDLQFVDSASQALAFAKADACAIASRAFAARVFGKPSEASGAA